MGSEEAKGCSFPALVKQTGSIAEANAHKTALEEDLKRKAPEAREAFPPEGLHQCSWEPVLVFHQS